MIFGAIYLINFFISLIVFLAFWLLSKVINRLLKKSLEKTTKKKLLIEFILQVSKIFIILLGTLTSLATLGINVAPVITSLGLGGLGLSLAMKDVLANMIGGIILMLFQTFDVEDKIEVNGVEGLVLAIDFRYTTLINEQKELCYLPNSTLLKSSIRLVEKKTS